MSLSASIETTLRAETGDSKEGQETMGLEFYVLNHVLYLIISPPIDKGPGDAKANQRQPLWRAVMV